MYRCPSTILPRWCWEVAQVYGLYERGTWPEPGWRERETAWLWEAVMYLHGEVMRLRREDTEREQEEYERRMSQGKG